MSARVVSLLAALGLFAPALAHAADVEVSPGRVEARGRSATREVRVANHGAAPMRVALYAATWDQSRDGQAELTPTEELAVSPATLTLAPGESQPVRVEVRGPAEPFELAYQLVVQEQPSGAAAPATVTVPIFVEPDRAAPHAELSPPQLLGCTASVELRNSGNAHMVVKRVRIEARDGEGKVVATFEHAIRDVLSGVAETVSDILPHGACNATTVLRAEVETGTGEFHAAGYFMR